MKIEENVALATLTTMHVGGPARYLLELDSSDTIGDALTFAQEKNLPTYLLGGGSNIIASDSGFQGVIIRMNSKNISIVRETPEVAYVKFDSGIAWDDVVLFAINNGLWGIENLSIVPGNGGAFVVQNVGCYGQEARDVVVEVSVFDTRRMDTEVISAEACSFTYRSSIFNTTDRNRYIILSTTIRLSKTPQPNLTYPDVLNYFNSGAEPTLKNIRSAIISIRKKKFADPKLVGTCGSCFKNNTVTQDEFDTIISGLSKNYNEFEIIGFVDICKKLSSDSQVKMPTAYILDHFLHLPGYAIGGALISPTQAVAIINPDRTATAKHIIELIQFVQKEYYSTIGIPLGVEPELLGFPEDEIKSIKQYV